MKAVELTAGEDLGKLGELFFARLQSERLHFAAMSAALAQAEGAPAGIFDDLHFRAHRLKGTAAMFEFKDIAAAAHVLEHAAQSAAGAHADNTDARVWAALVGLVSLLGHFETTATR